MNKLPRQPPESENTSQGMIQILTSDAYRGFSSWLKEATPSPKDAIQVIFIGRIRWPEDHENTDAIIKIYKTNTCGVANEAIGYTANAMKGVDQPRRGAILLLDKTTLPDLGYLNEFIDQATGLAVCWLTSYEQTAKPFRYIRRLPSFTDRQSHIFFRSQFCQRLAGVDHVTGNNDRHEGNFLYIDDLRYMAIDQGCVGGGAFWHTLWPDDNASNELLLLVKNNLTASQLSEWYASALADYHSATPLWADVIDKIGAILIDLLPQDQIQMIINYMAARSASNQFAESCGKLC